MAGVMSHFTSGSLALARRNTVVAKAVAVRLADRAGALLELVVGVANMGRNAAIAPCRLPERRIPAAKREIFFGCFLSVLTAFSSCLLLVHNYVHSLWGSFPGSGPGSVEGRGIFASTGLTGCS